MSQLTLAEVTRFLFAHRLLIKLQQTSSVTAYDA